MGLRQRKTPLKPSERPSNVVAMPQCSVLPPPPAELELPEQALWASLTATFKLDDDASLAILLAALEARGRARRLRATIDEQGEVIDDRHGLRAHPLLQHERGSHALFLQGMKALRLDTAGV